MKRNTEFWKLLMMLMLDKVLVSCKPLTLSLWRCTGSESEMQLADNRKEKKAARRLSHCRVDVAQYLHLRHRILGGTINRCNAR